MNPELRDMEHRDINRNVVAYILPTTSFVTGSDIERFVQKHVYHGLPRDLPTYVHRY